MKFYMACMLLLASCSFTHAADTSISLAPKRAFYTLEEQLVYEARIGWYTLQRENEQLLKVWIHNRTFEKLQKKANKNGFVCIAVREELTGRSPKAITLPKERFKEFAQEEKENPASKQPQTFHTLSFVIAVARRSVTTLNLSKSC